MAKQKPALNPDRLYLGDNGRCFCGALKCAGMTAHFTGRDLSGQGVLELRREEVEAAGLALVTFHCEGCGSSLEMLR